MTRSEFIENLMISVPDNSKKTCRNCYNSYSTLAQIGFYWARERCKCCQNFSQWSYIENLLNEIKRGILSDYM